ncbi:MADF domain-containing protein [Aphelenchoides fujianensis]|nr:MADF domain-containing protein [Aphelenchoides fujianensis]
MCARLEAEEKLMFVELMRVYPEVWDQKHADYKSRRARADAFADLSKRLAARFEKPFDVETLKESWKNLKTTFHMYRKGRRGGPSGAKADDSGANGELNANWPIHIAKMSYLGGDAEDTPHQSNEDGGGFESLSTPMAADRLAHEAIGADANAAHRPPSSGSSSPSKNVAESLLSSFSTSGFGSPAPQPTAFDPPAHLLHLQQLIVQNPALASLLNLHAVFGAKAAEEPTASPSISPTSFCSRKRSSVPSSSSSDRSTAVKRQRAEEKEVEVEVKHEEEPKRVEEAERPEVPPAVDSQPNARPAPPPTAQTVEPFLLEAHQLFHKLDAFSPALARLMKREVQRLTEKYEDAMLGIEAKSSERKGLNPQH